MKIPYSKPDLQLALFSLDEEIFTDEKLKELEEELEKEEFAGLLLSEDKRDMNKKIAEFQGISVEALINSSNYKILCTEYEEYLTKKFVAKIIEKLNITEKQAWALVFFSSSALD